MSDTQVKLYYCKRCKNAYPTIVDEKNQEKMRKFSETFTARFLTCNHAINILDVPISYGSESRIADESPEPTELRETNVAVTLEFLRMNQEQRENFIQFHVAQYQLHLRTAKKEKYILQVLEDEVDKYIKMMNATDDEKKRITQRFDYTWRRPEKRLEILAKEKAREDVKAGKKEQSKEDMFAKLRDMMRKSEIDPSLLLKKKTE